MDEIISLDDSDRRALARAEFAESWHRLRATADGVKEYLRALPTSVFYSPHPRHSSPEDAQAHIVASVDSWFYDDEQLPNETRKYHGAVALPKEGLLEMQRLNDAKACFMADWDRLRHWVEGCPETGVRRKPPRTADRSLRQAELDALLRANGLARINYRQVKRHFHILRPAPRLISFSLSRTKNVRRRSWQEAHDNLARLADTSGSRAGSIAECLSKLGGIPQDEPLVEVIDIDPQVRINVAWSAAGMAGRRNIKTNLPVVYGVDGATEIRGEVTEKPPRAPRSGRKINPVPFLPAIRVHRYL